MFGLYRRRTLAMTSLHRKYYGSDCALLAEVALLGGIVRLPQTTLFSRNHPMRSVNSHNSARLIWQNPGASGRNAFEFSEREFHLIKIAHRHKQLAPLHETLPPLAVWFIHPLRCGRCALELIGAASPTLRNLLRGCIFRVLNSNQPITNRRQVRSADARQDF